MIFLTELEKNHEIHMEAQKTPKTSKKKNLYSFEITIPNLKLH